MKQYITFILLFMGSLGNAQSISGTWYGQLNVKGTHVRINFHIHQNGTAYSGTMDSPDQGALGLETEGVTYEQNALSITSSKYGINYKGVYNKDSNLINGTFSQGGMNLPLVLYRDSILKTSAATAAPKRLQDPKDYPYLNEDVTIENVKSGVTLAGTLTMPKDKKPTKIVIMITGSGPQNRNEEIVQFNHRPFLVWSDYLTKQGIAVLRYDDRGIAKSTGNFATATSSDFADDVEAAIAYLKNRPDTKGLSIGLIGHSEGGMIAPIVATRNKNVQFIVLLAGPGVPIYQLMIKQAGDQDRLNGTPEKVAVLNHDASIAVFSYLAKTKGLSEDELKKGVGNVLTTSLMKYPKDIIGNTPIQEIVDKESRTYLSPWFRYFITYDPKDYLSKVHCPVLAINGTKDSQVSCDENLSAIQKNLQLAGNTNYKIVPLKDLNHLMQNCKTGSVSEYAEIEETVDPIALQTVSNWIKKM